MLGKRPCWSLVLMKSYGNAIESEIQHVHFSLFFFNFSQKIRFVEHITMFDI